MTQPGADPSSVRRTASGTSGAGPGPSATGAKVAAVGLWVVVVAGLAYGVSQALVTAGKLFG